MRSIIGATAPVNPASNVRVPVQLKEVKSGRWKFSQLYIKDVTDVQYLDIIHW